jgi:peptide/nickel transport system permease protein
VAIAGQASEQLGPLLDVSALQLSWRERLSIAARENRLAAAGVLVILLVVLLTMITPIFYTTDPAITTEDTLEAPSADHLMGTDFFGRDVLARLLDAAKLDFRISILVTLLAFGIGSLVGAVAGYIGGLLEEAVMRLTDLLLSFPAFILALAITAMLGNEIKWVIVSLGIAYVPYFIRLTRGEVLKIRDSDFADAARTVGNSPWRVATRHIFPNSITGAFVLATLVLGWSILDAAALGFLGIGIKAPTTEWGTMVADGSANIVTGQWWTWFFPGMTILIVVLAFNWIGDGLRNLLRSA